MNRVGNFISIALVVVSLAACSHSSKKAENSEVPQAKMEQIAVKKGNLTPTFSTKGVITRAKDFTMSLPIRGKSKILVHKGEEVKKGQPLASVGSESIVSPVDAKVIDTLVDGDYSAHYPLVTLSYSGFAIQIDASSFINYVNHLMDISAKFQLTDGLGPQQAIAVVHTTSIISETTLEAGEDANQSKINVELLVEKDLEVVEGQSGTVVVTAKKKEGSLLLPLATVAGRKKKGSVNLLEGDQRRIVEVELGDTDGAYIEILSPLKEGDLVSSYPPNLDPREK